MIGRCVAVACVAWAAGCAAPPSPAPLPPTDPRVFLTPDAGVLADPPLVVPGTLMRATVRLVNPSPSDRPIIETTDWVNAAGLPIRTLLSAPQRLTVPRFGDSTVEVIAPNASAVQFRVRVEPDYSN